MFRDQTRPLVERKGEILGLTWDCIDLKQRIMFLGVQKTKERAKKKVPCI